MQWQQVHEVIWGVDYKHRASGRELDSHVLKLIHTSQDFLQAQVQASETIWSIQPAAFLFIRV